MDAIILLYRSSIIYLFIKYDFLTQFLADQETHREILKSMMTKLALFINDLRRKNEDEINRTMAVAGEFGETSDEWIFVSLRELRSIIFLHLIWTQSIIKKIIPNFGPNLKWAVESRDDWFKSSTTKCFQCNIQKQYFNSFYLTIFFGPNFQTFIVSALMYLQLVSYKKLMKW